MLPFAEGVSRENVRIEMTFTALNSLPFFAACIKNAYL